MIANFVKENRPDYFPVNDAGFLEHPVNDLRDVSSLNRQVLKDLEKVCRTCLGDGMIAIYFRGSQTFSTRESDFDTIIIVEDTCATNSKELSSVITSRFDKQYYHINYFDTTVIKVTELANDRSLQFILKVLSIPVYGASVADGFPGFKINSELVFLLKNVIRKTEMVIYELGQAKHKDRFKMSNYIVKYLLRSAFELVMIRESTYTREINCCEKGFAKYYPQYSDKSSRILSYYNQKEFEWDVFVTDIKVFSEVLFGIHSKENV